MAKPGKRQKRVGLRWWFSIRNVRVLFENSFGQIHASANTINVI
jgi:hypothetical protein